MERESMNPENVYAAPEAKPLDEAVWQAWVAKGRAADKRGSNKHLEAMKWVAIAVLLSSVVLWSRAEPFEVAIRFLVVVGAIAVILQTLRTGRYLFAALFGGLARLFNPMAPIFEFSGDWPRPLLVASAAPFRASLAWRNTKAVA